MFKLFSYLRRGHAVYTSLAIGICNFLVIQYKLAVSDVPWLAELFPSMFWFGLVLGGIYVPIAIMLGWHDFKRGSMAADCEHTAKANPYSRDMAQAIVLLGEGKPEEAAEKMRKWC